MIAYSIKSTLCLLLLWSFYKLFLEKEHMHNVKRFYLLFSVIFAYVIPLITITYQVEVDTALETPQTPVTTVILNGDIPQKESPVNYIPIILWTIYGIGALIFGLRFLVNMNAIINKIKGNEKLIESSHTNVLLTNTTIPHTFLKFIFVPKKEFQQKSIPTEVMLHEQAHVKQRHTLDILLVQLLQVFFWFNPLWFWFNKSIRLNHEFLADQTVLKKQFSLQNYIELLVSYPSSPHQTALSSPINYSLTKKRIIMMSRQFSKTRTAVRMLLFLPILLGCMLLFNNDIVAQQRTINCSGDPS